MKKQILTTFIVLSLISAFVAGCNQTNTSDVNNTETTPEATITVENDTNATTVNTSAKSENSTPKPTEKEKEKEENKKISTKNLSETSTPIGISELSVNMKNDGVYASCRVTNNETKYDSIYVQLDFDVLDSSGKKVDLFSTSSIFPENDALEQGESYIYERWLGIINDDEIEQKVAAGTETLTLKVSGIVVEDAAKLDRLEAFYDSSQDLTDYLQAETYNSAQLVWDAIKEEYGSDFPKDIEFMEATMKDMGLDPNNISAGVSPEKAAEIEFKKTLAEIEDIMDNLIPDYNKAKILIEDALVKYPDNTDLKVYQAKVNEKLNEQLN